MAKINEIEITKLLFDEGAAASTPAATNVAIYAKSDGLMYSRDDAGVETLMSVGSAQAGYSSRRILAVVANTNETLNVNSTTYLNFGCLLFYWDFDEFPATSFCITATGGSNAAGENILFQLAENASPTSPYSSGGDDLTLTNTNTQYTSGWIAINGVKTGRKLLCIAAKGSTATVDFTGRWVDIEFKY